MAEQKVYQVTASQVLAAQLVEKLERMAGRPTTENTKKIADAGRRAGILLISERYKSD